MCVSREPGFRQIAEVVADVREVSRLRLHARGRFQRLAYAQMLVGWGFVAQRVDDQGFHARDKVDIASGTALQSLNMRRVFGPRARKRKPFRSSRRCAPATE